MKKLFITAAIATMFSVTAFAAKGGKTIPATGEDKISYSVLNQFNADFKGAKNTVWAVTANCQKAIFTVDGMQATAFYDMAGTYLGVTQTITYKDIPYAAQEEITAKYAGYAVKEVVKYQSEGIGEEAPATYFVDLKKADSEIIVKTATGENVTPFKTIK